MKLMIIEDKAEDVVGIEDYAKGKQWEVLTKGFDDGLAQIEQFNPDVVILDRKDDGDGDETRGESVFSIIWKSKFRPTIVFSGLAESFNVEDQFKELAVEPLFCRISKGDEQPVIQRLEYFQGIVPSLSRLRDKLNIAMINSAQALSMIQNASIKTSDDVIDYLFANRLSQYFQTPVLDEQLPAFVHYIVPPITKHALSCDVLKSVVTKSDQEPSYAIILTPSCDLARTDEDAYVLVANNCDFSKIGGERPVDKESKSYRKWTVNVSKILSKGFGNSKLYLPALKGTMPNLCFDMKNLSIISLSSIALSPLCDFSGKEWIRVASLASPYRERAMWAYQSTACRPGVPDLNTMNWAEDIFNESN